MKFLASLCAVGVIAGSTSASLMVFTDRTEWETAVGGGILTEDFNNIAPQIIDDGNTLDTGLLQITRDGSPNGGDGLLEIEPGANFGNIDGTTFLSGETGAAPHERVDIQFGGDEIFAFGADWFSPFSGDGIALEVGGELILLDSIAGFDTGFVGFISDADTFSEISIVGNPEDLTFQELWSADNLSFAVPSPAALAVLGMGGLVAGRRRRH